MGAMGRRREESFQFIIGFITRQSQFRLYNVGTPSPDSAVAGRRKGQEAATICIPPGPVLRRAVPRGGRALDGSNPRSSLVPLRPPGRRRGRGRGAR